ncbi:MAG: OsmC family protein, partial [Gemmatimonadaceae bacterium]
MSGTIPAAAKIVWAGEHRFDASAPGTASIRMDVSGKTGISPVTTLIAALGGCVSVDVVDILAKRKTPVESLQIDLQATRVDGTPKRLASATLNFDIKGAGIERSHAERAIDLAINKYCSVRDSLREDIPIAWTLTLNGEKRDSASAKQD